MSVFNALRDQLNLLLNDVDAEKEGPKTLLIADENIELEDVQSLPKNIALTILTNRKDLELTCVENRYHVIFNDFDFEHLPSTLTDPERNSTFDFILYRISKERPLVHHILNQIYQISNDESRLLLCGKKNEGIKNYHQKLIKHALFSGKLTKDGDIYSSILNKVKNTGQTSDNPPTFLDEKQYSSKREIVVSNDGIRFQSKPGLYGWDKVDSGSRFLVEQCKEYLESNTTQKNPHQVKIQNALDLGCGFGYLSLNLIELAKIPASALSSINTLTATDNNAAAVQCCETNLHEKLNELALNKNIDLKVFADDCGQSIKEKFDLILCNPPFHQGFDHKQDLSNKFCAGISRLLEKSGIAFVVVNVFIPFETLAQSHSLNCKTLANNKQFKVLLLTKS